MLTQNDGTTLTSYVYNTADQPCWSVSGTTSASCSAPPTGSDTFTYDSEGNLTGVASSAHPLSMSYNNAEQTTAINSVSLAYGDLGQNDLLSAGTDTFAYSLMGMARKKDTNAKYYRYTRRPDGTMASEEIPDGAGVDVFHYLYNAQHDVIGLATDSGSLAGSYTYDAYGRQSGTPPAADNPWRYQGGQYMETTINMFHYGARFYYPWIGRWTQQDPQGPSLRAPITVDRYLFNGDDPVNNVDPSGNDWWNPFSWSACTWFSVFGAVLGILSLVSIFYLPLFLGVVTLVFPGIALLGAYQAGCLS